jgi:hypothetical protein
VLFCDPGSVTLVGKSESWFGDEEADYRHELMVVDMRGGEGVERHDWTSSSGIQAY